MRGFLLYSDFISNQKKEDEYFHLPNSCCELCLLNYYLSSLSSDTVSLFLPLALRLASTLRPFLVAILALKPCLLALLRLDGWNVLLLIFLSYFGVQK